MNTPKKYVDCKTADTLRSATENVGKWIYYLTTEGINEGLTVQFAKDAMYELGEYYAGKDFVEVDSVKTFTEKILNRSMELGHEAEIKVKGNDSFDVSINYCPMLNMWNQLTEDDESKKSLCDVACTMFTGLGEKKGYSVVKESSIACGCDKCVFCFKKK